MDLGLKRGEMSEDRVLEVEALSFHHRNIAVNDLFALVLAASRGLPLLTGDNYLRALALKHNVCVHGTLWILDELVTKGVIIPAQACQALQHMLDHGSRLPPAECSDRFRKWG